MATNRYFRSNYASGLKDQRLLENLIIEAIQARGIDVFFLPRSFVNLDQLFGEDQSSAFNQALPIEMYIKTVDSFEGDGHLLSKFGFELRDEVVFSVSRRRFGDCVEYFSNVDVTRPREGDLIKMPPEVDQRERLFEITFVDEDELFYELGKLYTYELRCKVFEFGGETFDTGEESIDSFPEDYAINGIITMQSGGTGDFVVGETVTQGTASGEVVSWSPPELVLTKITGFEQVSTTDPVVGQTSGASWTPDSIRISNEDTLDNDEFKDPDFIDFSETNPFSEQS